MVGRSHRPWSWKSSERCTTPPPHGLFSVQFERHTTGRCSCSRAPRSQPATRTRHFADERPRHLGRQCRGGQRALLAAGFEPGGASGDDDYVGLHHLRPLRVPGETAAFVEVHRRPGWVKFVDPLTTRELLAAATEGATGVPGVLALPPAHHALVLAAHSWDERPMRRLLDLIDIAAVTAGKTGQRFTPWPPAEACPALENDGRGGGRNAVRARRSMVSANVGPPHPRGPRYHRLGASPLEMVEPVLGPASALRRSGHRDCLRSRPDPGADGDLEQQAGPGPPGRCSSHAGRHQIERVLGREGVQPRFKRR